MALPPIALRARAPLRAEHLRRALRLHPESLRWGVGLHQLRRQVRRAHRREAERVSPGRGERLTNGEIDRRKKRARLCPMSGPRRLRSLILLLPLLRQVLRECGGETTSPPRDG